MILTIQNITKSFGKKEVLKGISFNLEKGKLYGIVGENGSGKSTLLKIIIGLYKADSGIINVNGRVGYCPQKPLVFSQLTVKEHIQYFSAAYNLKKIDYQKQFNYFLKHFNFEKYKYDKVEILSGGTRQKLNLTLALLHEPELLILDEPYNGFDWDTYMKFWELTNKLLDKGCTILIVTHFLNETDRFNYIFNLKNGYLS